MHILYAGRTAADMLRYLQEHGHDVRVILGKDDLTHADAKPDVPYYLTDFQNKESFLAGLPISEITAWKPEAVVVTYENAVLPKQWIGEYFHLAVPTLEAVLAATDKVVMRQKFHQFDPSITPAHREVDSWKDIEAFVQEYGFPVMLKPANLVKSLLISKSENEAQLRENFAYMQEHIQEIYDKEYVSNRQPRVLIEEFMTGQSYSVEGFADGSGQVVTAEPVDLVFGRDRGEDDNYNYSRKLPSILPLDEQVQLQEVARKGIQALGLTNSPAHVELIYGKNGPRIVEIGARTGGYRGRMYEYSRGVDLYQAQIQVAQGQLPELQPTKEEFVAVYEIFPQQDGLFHSLEGWEKLRDIPGIRYQSIKHANGERVGKAQDGFRAVAVVIVHTPDKTTFEMACQYVETQVRVQVEA